MHDAASMIDRIGRSYPSLSDKLQQAADYVAHNQVDIATRSLRSIAAASGISPATYSRLARALGYDDYEQMREDGRATMGQRMDSFSARAAALRAEARSDAKTVLHNQAAACVANIEILARDTSEAQLKAVADLLHRSRKVLLIGSMGSSGFADYFSYLAHWFTDNWQVAGRNGTTLAAALAPMGGRDAVFAVAKAPYARRTVAGLKAAYDKGVPTVLITDSHSSPALEFADHHFITASESPQFFSSYAATLVLIETIITLVLTKAGPDAEEKIRDTEQQIRNLGESWA